MHVILTGATGLVGTNVLHTCLASPAITKLSILSRRPFQLPASDNNTEIIIHKDYESYPPALITQLQGADACIWALGVGRGEVAKDEEYIRIMHDFPVAAAKAFSTLGERINFVFVSGEGADPTEQARRLYYKIKGRTEKDLLSLNPSSSSDSPQSPYPSLRVFNVRPGYVEPTSSQRSTLPFSKRLIHGIASPLFRALQPGFVSPADVLAKVLVQLATENGEPLLLGVDDGVEEGGRTVRCVGVKKLSGNQ
ncbi:hypothetical protein C8F01DRAFT_1221634 [Mycena amicta]|nr:hypothetical protein C8F01DRAFT_1221634 [Mycena amicta]